MNDVDLLRIARYKVGLDKMVKDEHLMATDIDNDNEIATDIDLLKMARILVHIDKF